MDKGTLKMKMKKENEEYLKALLDGITDALLDGKMSDHRPYGYKQGYDFGIFLYGCLEDQG